MSQQIQTVIFSKEQWDVGEAKRWLADHDMRNDKVDETGDSYRFRQFDSSECQEGSFQTLSENFPDGVKAVSCERSAGRAATMPSAAVITMLEKRLTHVQAGQDSFLSIRKGYASEVEPDGGDTGKLRFVISTDSVDRLGDIIEVDRWQLDNYRKSPIVLFGHEYGEVGGSPPAQGRSVEIGTLPRAGRKVLASTVEFHRSTRFNNELYAMYRDGFMNTASVGFWPTVEPEYMKNDAGEVTGFRFKGQDLLEWSLVAVPANPDAVQMALRKGIIRPKTAEFLCARAGLVAGRTPEGAEYERLRGELALRSVHQWSEIHARRIQQETGTCLPKST